MTATFSVKNFEHFQHYKDRNPPWIKLYNELLDNYEFGCLQDASKLHLIAIWLLASRANNKLPFDNEWIAKRINATAPVDLDALVEAGFLVPDQGRKRNASKPLAKCLSRDRERDRGETETEGERKNGASAPVHTPLSELSLVIRQDLATAVLAHRVKLKAPLSTVLAARAFGKKLAKWHDPNAAAEEVLANGWRGFEPAWMESRINGSHGPPGRLVGKRSPTLEAADRLVEKYANEKAEDEPDSNVLDLKPNC